MIQRKEKIVVPLNWNKHYFQNGYTVQRILQIRCNSHQSIMDIFHRNRTNNHKIYAELQKLQVAKAILRKKKKAGCITIPSFSLHYKTIVIKTAWFWHKNGHMVQRNRITESINSHTNCQLIYDKGGKNLQ